MVKINELSYDEKQELNELVYELESRKARKHILDFTKFTLSGFKVEDFHKKYYTLLNEFAYKRIKNLIITMPPQHGKSEGSTRRLPSFVLGLFPNTKIAVASYNDPFASKFNRDVQRIIDSDKYNNVFPDTTLSRSNVVTVSSNYLRNSHEFEVVGYKGGLKSVGRGGPLTGNPVDVMIMDDLYKDYMEGNSPVIRQTVWDWYTSVVQTRLHNDSQQLIVFTRWHEEDLIGLLEEKGKVHEISSIEELDNLELKQDEWVKVNFEALKTFDPTPIDPREKGEALWPGKHSVEKLNSAKEIDKEKFECLYQGNPSSAEGLLYTPFKTIGNYPAFKIIKNYTDTADTGKDNLCSIVYGVPLDAVDRHLYIIDVLYTDEPMEATEPLTIDLLNDNKVNKAKIESNNGGRGFARVVKKGVSCHVDWFHQSANKEARIFSNSAQVNERIVMPRDWHIRWPDFYNDVSKYKKLFAANKKDDAADTLTGIVEEETLNKGKYAVR